MVQDQGHREHMELCSSFFSSKIKKPLTVVGDGKQKRDFTYISDAIEAFFKATRVKKKFQIFNLGTGKPTAVNYIVKLLGCKSINIPKRPGEPDITSAKINKIKKQLNWKPKITIEQGVKKSSKRNRLLE